MFSLVGMLGTSPGGCKAKPKPQAHYSEPTLSHRAALSPLPLTKPESLQPRRTWTGASLSALHNIPRLHFALRSKSQKAQHLKLAVARIP